MKLKYDKYFITRKSYCDLYLFKNMHVKNSQNKTAFVIVFLDNLKTTRKLPVSLFLRSLD